VQEAERTLEGLIRTEKNATVGKHPFSHFISPNENDLKLVEIEQEILKSVQERAKGNYGVEVTFLGIKKLGLPESITQKVFDRMKAERDRLVQEYKGQGESQSIIIRTAADGERDRILAEAMRTRCASAGRGDAEAAKFYSVFEKAPNWRSIFGSERARTNSQRASTLILDQRTPRSIC
jgi:membrane protease subunit HflC